MSVMSTIDPDVPLGTPAAGASSVDKALGILTILINSDAPLCLTELSRKAGLAKSTVHRLLEVLQSHRMVSRLGYKYLPGEQVSSVAQWADARFLSLLRSESTPYLVELHHLTGETASISLLSGHGVHHVNKIYGHHAVRGYSSPSGQASTVVTDDAIRQILFAYQMDPLGSATVDTADRQRYVKVRRTGIAQSHDHERGLLTIAVPVQGFRNPPPSVALAVTGRTGRFEPATTIAALRRSAFDLARTIRNRGRALG